jgi:leucyl aminopeptidase
MTLKFASLDEKTTPLHILAASAVSEWMTENPTAAEWARRLGFSGSLGEGMLLPTDDGEVAVIGYGTPEARRRGRFHVAMGAASLPKGVYQIVSPLDDVETEALGWLLARYAFDRYSPQSGISAELVAPQGVDAIKIEAIATGEALTRDLINTPAADMGPDSLERAARELATTHDAAFEVIVGDDLLDQNFPMIHAVGRANDRAPRLLDMRWGTSGPKLTLVGKGVCFDTGGLNLKPGASMGLMKKDMGGSAAVLGLAHMIMSLKMGVQLRVLIPAVENSVSGNSFRPQDILTSRKNLSVEINNTDAEGRLVLADALTFAEEENPDCLISMATLTGAARVAVGPDIAPYFTGDDGIAEHLPAAAETVSDPVWRMPFWDPYEKMIEPGVADLDNAPKGGFGGAITAALFLRRFVERPENYTHFDIYGWQPSPAPGRPKGGVGQGTRALLEALPKVLGID